MMRTLTVEENLLFAARSRLPARWSETEKFNYVCSIIELLGLEDIRHSIIGDEENRGISGGQRKVRETWSSIPPPFVG